MRHIDVPDHYWWAVCVFCDTTLILAHDEPITDPDEDKFWTCRCGNSIDWNEGP